MRARSTIFTLFVEYVYPERAARVRDLVAMMAALGFSEMAVRAALSRSAKRGWVVPKREGRAAYYALSDRVYWQVRQVRRRLYGSLPRGTGASSSSFPRGPRSGGEGEVPSGDGPFGLRGAAERGLSGGRGGPRRPPGSSSASTALAPPASKGSFSGERRRSSGPSPWRRPRRATGGFPPSWVKAPRTPWRPSATSPGSSTRRGSSSSWTPASPGAFGPRLSGAKGAPPLPFGPGGAEGPGGPLPQGPFPSPFRPLTRFPVGLGA